MTNARFASLRGLPVVPLTYESLGTFEGSFRDVQAELTPGSKLGEVNITNVVQDRIPFRPFVGYDNAGVEIMGKDQLFAGFEWANVFGLDQRLNYQYTTDNPAARSHRRALRGRTRTGFDIPAGTPSPGGRVQPGRTSAPWPRTRSRPRRRDRSDVSAAAGRGIIKGLFTGLKIFQTAPSSAPVPFSTRISRIRFTGQCH